MLVAVACAIGVCGSQKCIVIITINIVMSSSALSANYDHRFLVVAFSSKSLDPAFLQFRRPRWSTLWCSSIPPCLSSSAPSFRQHHLCHVPSFVPVFVFVVPSSFSRCCPPLMLLFNDLPRPIVHHQHRQHHQHELLAESTRCIVLGRTRYAIVLGESFRTWFPPTCTEPRPRQVSAISGPRAPWITPPLLYPLPGVDPT